MRTIIKIFTVLFLGFLWSCEEIIDLPLETGAPRLVIDALINIDSLGRGIPIVKLSKVSSYYDALQEDVVDNATVTITDKETKKVYNLLFVDLENPGIGITTTLGSGNTKYYTVLDEAVPVNKEKTFLLEVVYNNEVYTAESLVPPFPEIIELTQEMKESPFGNSFHEIKITLKNRKDTLDFFRASFTNDTGSLVRVDLADDSFYGEKNVELIEIIGNDDLEEGQNDVTITLSQIDEVYYKYGRFLEGQSGRNRGPFQVSTATARGNISNKTNTENFPLGFFRTVFTTQRNITLINNQEED